MERKGSSLLKEYRLSLVVIVIGYTLAMLKAASMATKLLLIALVFWTILLVVQAIRDGALSQPLVLFWMVTVTVFLIHLSTIISGIRSL